MYGNETGVYGNALYVFNSHVMLAQVLVPEISGDHVDAHDVHWVRYPLIFHCCWAIFWVYGVDVLDPVRVKQPSCTDYDWATDEQAV